MKVAAGDTARSYLLVRRGGSLWGVADAMVEGRTEEGAFRILAGSEALRADEILAVVERLRIVPAGATLVRWWPERVAGLAVHCGQPLVVIDRERPPRALRASPGETPAPPEATEKAGKPATAKTRARRGEKERTGE
jgi:hypothetical protein